MALSTRLVVTKRDRWSSQHPTLEGHREQKAVTLQPITCVHKRRSTQRSPSQQGNYAWIM